MEACGSAHHWARLAMGLGHQPALMCPQFVVPYVKSNKNDIDDADAIVDASMRLTMRFVGVKSVPQRQIQQVHCARADGGPEPHRPGDAIAVEYLEPLPMVDLAALSPEP